MSEAEAPPVAIDYAESGMNIQTALLDHFKRFPDKATRPKHILWGGLAMSTGDSIPVPKRGEVEAEFLSIKDDVRQGFDLKVKGWIQLQDRRVKLLRTWHDPDLEDTVRYSFGSQDGLLRVWNVYEMSLRGGQVFEEKWTGNAGFWVERVSETERIYHCSHGMASPPDFESLVFRVRVF